MTITYALFQMVEKVAEHTDKARRVPDEGGVAPSNFDIADLLPERPFLGTKTLSGHLPCGKRVPLLGTQKSLCWAPKSPFAGHPKVPLLGTHPFSWPLKRSPKC